MDWLRDYRVEASIRREIIATNDSGKAKPLAAETDKIVLNLGEVTGNIWMTQLPGN